ncbi:hypothetical protein MG293_018827 [Ovis ammon polii]|uniref:G-protein coupled receptors family 1 profile domain-containing protein n=1 Tax=Ovis ammon polii TaxID=230172 RepID=A0AAD4TRC5_OVIAM|nr:hypothetical protein MG293_018827 [Ovis ammon polii]
MINESLAGDFILVGFSDNPQLEKILFAVVLISYLLTLVGNTAIILISYQDPMLHTPMYYFLTHLSFVDLCFTTSIAPQLLWNLRGPYKTISSTGCAIQLYVSLALGSTECVLLAVMAFDRYAAVCRPLHYATVMHSRLCQFLVGMAWLSGVGNTLIQSTITLRLPRCGNRRIYHFICEVPAMVKLACVNIRANEVQLFMASLVLLLLPLTLILISYGCIAQAVMRIRNENKCIIMNWANESSLKEFVLLGFSDKPWLQKPLFVLLLISYTTTIFGNVSIMMVCILDPKLHTPMYFFLANLSILDLCYTTSTVPHMLTNISHNKKTISYAGCVAQLITFLALGATECLLLAVMSFDRFSAVCRPLHYMTIMNSQLCQGLVGTPWVFGVINCMILSPYAMSLPRCQNHHLDYFFCEMSAMIKIACVDTMAMEATTFAMCLIIILAPLLLILVSYGFIAVAVLKIKSATGRQKAFGTCSSHLIVVSIFYGIVIYMYIQPGNSPNQNEGKLLSTCHSIVILSMNPLIYTLRNKEFKGAIKRLIGKRKVLWKQ